MINMVKKDKNPENAISRDDLNKVKYNDLEPKIPINNLSGNTNSNDLFSSLGLSDEYYKSLKEMYKTDGETDIRTKTYLNDRIVSAIIRLKVYAEECKQFDKYDNTFPKITDLVNDKLLMNLFALRISIQGKGREQFFKALIHKSEEEKKSRFAGLFGLGGK